MFAGRINDTAQTIAFLDNWAGKRRLVTPSYISQIRMSHCGAVKDPLETLPFCTKSVEISLNTGYTAQATVAGPDLQCILRLACVSCQKRMDFSRIFGNFISRGLWNGSIPDDVRIGRNGVVAKLRSKLCTKYMNARE